MNGLSEKHTGESMLKMKSGLHIGGVLAVLPIDAFTGQPVRTRDFTVEIDGERPPVKKSDGFFVFSRAVRDRGGGLVPLQAQNVGAVPGKGCCPPRGQSVGTVSGIGCCPTQVQSVDAVPEKDCCPPQGKAGAVTIRLSGRGYRDTVVHREITGMPGAAGGRTGAQTPVLMIPVNPGRDYRFLPDTVFLEGRIPAGSCLKAAFLQKAGCLRLAQDYRAGSVEMFLCANGQKDTAGGFAFVCGESVLSGKAEYCETEEFALSGKAEYCTGEESDLSGKAGQAGSGEFCLLGARTGAGGGCLLQKPLTQDYDGKKTCLYPARMQEAGEREEDYFFAFPASEPSGVLYCRLETAESIREYRLPVRGAETKRMDF